MHHLFIIQICSLVITSSAFYLQSARQMTSCLSMKLKEPSIGNLPRKLKRKIRSSNETTFDQLYSPEFDNFLKNQAKGGVYENIMKTLNKKARHLKITLKPDFGVKPKIVLPTIVETAVAAGSFGTLVEAVKAAGLVETLSSGLFTVLAPTDEAFAKLPEGKVASLLADIPALTDILKYHVVEGVVKSKKVATLKDSPPAALNGKALGIKVSRDGEVTIEGAKLLKTDLKCSNGMIHVIDTVLIPK